MIFLPIFTQKNNPMLVMEEKITFLIPQKPPMVMIDKLLWSDSKTIRTGLLIRKKNIFCKNGFFSEPGLIENIAQTAAAGAMYSYNNNSAGDGKAPIGYIGAIKDLEIHFLPEAGSEIQTEVIIENRVLGITIITGKVFCEGRLAARCSMKIFVDSNGIIKP